MFQIPATAFIFTTFAIGSAHKDDVLPTVQPETPASSGLFDALGEAAFTLGAFGVAAIVVQTMKWRNSKNLAVRAAARKVDKVPFSEQAASPDGSASRRSLTPPGQQPLRARTAFSTSPATATSAQWSDARGESRFARPTPANVQRCSRQPGAMDNDNHATASPGNTDSKKMFDQFWDRAVAAGTDNDCLTESAAQHLRSSLRSCASRRCFKEALAAYDHAADRIGSGCADMWSLLLYSAVEAQEFTRCEHFFEQLCQNGKPSSNDFVNIVRYHVQQRDVEGLKGSIERLRNTGFHFDTIGRNRALSVCTSNRAFELAAVLADADFFDAPMDTVGYNTMMKGFAQAGAYEQCFKLYERMQQSGVKASEITFGIQLDACIDAKQPQRAKQVFAELRSSGQRLNVVHYTTFMKGLVASGLLREATDVLEEMLRSPDTKPDLVTYSTLVKAHSDAGKVMDAIRVLERMLEQGIVPDGIIFNIVLTGCCVNPMPVSQIFEVFQWLTDHGLQTSTTTLSIMVKALSKCEAWEPALELLNKAQQRLGVWPEARLYAQLAQACAKVGKNSQAIKSYASMIKSAAEQGTPVDESMNSRFYRVCSSCGESTAATQLYQAVARAGGFLEAESVSNLIASLQI